VREQLECIELCLGADEERVKSLWVRTKGQAHMGDTVVGAYYRPPGQEEEADETFYKKEQNNLEGHGIRNLRTESAQKQRSTSGHCDEEYKPSS